MLLTIDIGGTNTRLAIVEYRVTGIHLKNYKNYNSRDYQCLEEIIKNYETSFNLKIDSAVIGIPGPVVRGEAKTTNLPWHIEEKTLADKLQFSSVKLINDVEALGYSIEVLEPEDLEILNKGYHYHDSPIAVIAPGTGLGESFLVKIGQNYEIFPSEGGHSGFAPSNKLEIELLDYLSDRYPHVSCERTCSGPGIYNIYKFLKDRNICEEPLWLNAKLKKTNDPTKLISQNALEGDQSEPISVKALDLFVSILGAEVGNIALRLNAKNGVYIGGGIAPKISLCLRKDIFLKSFKEKGTLSNFIDDIPVKVIKKPEANLYGLANYASKLI